MSQIRSQSFNADKTQLNSCFQSYLNQHITVNTTFNNIILKSENGNMSQIRSQSFNADKTQLNSCFQSYLNQHITVNTTFNNIEV